MAVLPALGGPSTRTETRPEIRKRFSTKRIKGDLNKNNEEQR